MRSGSSIPGSALAKPLIGGDEDGSPFRSDVEMPPLSANTSRLTVEMQVVRQTARTLTFEQRQQEDYLTRLRHRAMRFWYAEPGTWSFLGAEAIKVSYIVAACYGMFTCCKWLACGAPATPEQSTCSVDYNELRIYELGLTMTLAIITTIVRGYLRKVEVNPSEQKTAHYTRRLRAIEDQLDLGLMESLDQLDDAQASIMRCQPGAISHLVSQLEILGHRLGSVDIRLRQIAVDLNEVDRIPFQQTKTHQSFNLLRAALIGVLTTCLVGYGFIWITSTLSKDPSVSWHGADAKEYPWTQWALLLFAGVSGLAGALGTPDDQLARSEELRRKRLAQYGELSRAVTFDKVQLLKEMTAVEKKLIKLNAADELQQLDRIPGPGSVQGRITALIGRIRALQEQASEISPLNVRNPHTQLTSASRVDYHIQCAL